MGRKKICMPFEKAREIVRSEKIESVAQYKKWHDLNKPVGLPRRPDRAYLGEFSTWNDYLGNNNPFPIKRRTFRSFGEAKAFAQSLNISKRRDWFNMCDEGGLPKDIPRRPDLYYRDNNEWVSWGNFLGVSLESKAQTISENTPIFFVIYNPKADKNYFKCGLTNGGISSVNDFLVKINGRSVCTYYVNQTFDVDKFVETCGGQKDYEHNGYYYIPDLTPIISKLSMTYQKAAH